MIFKKMTDEAETEAGSFKHNVIWYIGVYGAVLFGILMMMSAIGVRAPFTGEEDESLELPIQVTYTQTVSDSEARELGLDLVTTGHDKVRVTFTESAARFAYGFVVGLSFALGLCFIAWQLRCFLRRVRAGHPFADDNPGRIRRIGYVIAGCGPFYGLVTWFIARNYIDQVSISGATTSLYLDWHSELVFIGLIVIVIAQILQLGCRMQREQDLTV